MNNHGIKPFWRKVFRAAILLFSASITLLMVLNAVVVFFVLQKKAETNLDDIIGLSDKVMMSYLNQFDYSINKMSIINKLVDIKEKKNEYISLQRYKQAVEENINEFYFSMSGISGIIYCDDDNNLINVGRIEFEYANNVFAEVMEKYETTRKFSWYSVSVGDKNYLACYKRVGYLDSSFIMHSGGNMVIFVDEEQVYRESLTKSENGSSRILVLDRFNKICCGGLREYVGSDFNDIFKRKGGYFVIGDTNELCYIKHISSSVDGWKIVGVTPINDIYVPILLIIGISIGVLLVSGAAAVFVFYRVLSYMNIPLMRLSNQLKNVENGHYDTIEEINDETEIGYLYNSFNDMVSELNKQFNENYILNLKVKDAYIQTLEKQINPHFIFNTLQLIQMITLTGRTEDAFNVCGYFGEVVRFNLNEETEVQVEEEIENLKNYFKILEFRYYGELEYTINIPDEIMHFYTVKFLLQPIIENAMQHAFGQKNIKCRIDVMSKYYKDEIVFIVKDNGIGMSEERIKEVTEYINDESNISSSKSIGLRNTNQRIKLLYGEQFGIKLYSTPGKGTTVLVHLPVCKERKYLKKEEGHTDV